MLINEFQIYTPLSFMMILISQKTYKFYENFKCANKFTLDICPSQIDDCEK